MQKTFLVVLLLGSRIAVGQLPEALQRAEAAYMAGDYPEAERNFNEIDSSGLTDPDHLGRLNLLCARLKFVGDDPKGAEKCLIEAFRLAPNLNLDPYVDRPTLMARWRELQSQGTAQTSKQPSSFRRGAKSVFSLAPFGVGSLVNERNFEGGVFALANLSAVYACMSFDQLCLFSGLAIPALWGYELNENLPDFATSFPIGARVIYELMPLMPFGVAQFRNRQPTKAVTLAAVQLAGLLLVTHSASSAASSTAGALTLGISYGYALFDGWYHSNGKVEAPGLLAWDMRWNIWLNREGAPGLQLSVAL